MSEEPKTFSSKVYIQAETVVIRGSIAVVVVGFMWLFVDPVKNKLNSFIQIPTQIQKLEDQVNQRFQTLEERFNSLESVIDTPNVVEWQAIVQETTKCSASECVFTITFNRTEFGRDCGRPTSVTELRLGNSLPAETVLRDFVPVEGAITGTTVVTDVALYDTFVRDAKTGIPLYFRVINTYPHCPFPRQPVVERGPWWKIRV